MGAVPGGVSFLLATLEFLLMAAGFTGLFHYVPNTHVQWRHAIAGGTFAAIGIELAKRLLGWYLAQVPTYSVVYGAFATVPIINPAARTAIASIFFIASSFPPLKWTLSETVDARSVSSPCAAPSDAAYHT